MINKTALFILLFNNIRIKEKPCDFSNLYSYQPIHNAKFMNIDF